MTWPSFESLCPRIFEHPELGKVSWNERSRAFEAGRRIWGSSEYVPVLIHGEELLARAPFVLDAIERRRREFYACAAELMLARVPEAGPARRLRPGSVQLFDRRGTLWWCLHDGVAGSKIGVDFDGDCNILRASESNAGFDVVPTPVKAWLHDLPVQVDHALLGRVTLNLRASSYLGTRALGSVLTTLRLGLAAPLAASELEPSLDRCGALVEKVERRLEPAQAWCKAQLGSRKTSLVPEMLLLSEESAAVFFGTVPRIEDTHVSAWFGADGELLRAEITEATGPTRRFPVPMPAAEPELEHVHHTKFGAGEILEQLDGEKVRVRFADGCERVLLRSVLRAER